MLRFDLDGQDYGFEDFDLNGDGYITREEFDQDWDAVLLGSSWFSGCTWYYLTYVLPFVAFFAFAKTYRSGMMKTIETMSLGIPRYSKTLETSFGKVPMHNDWFESSRFAAFSVLG